jgi:acetyl esterase/lipase
MSFHPDLRLGRFIPGFSFGPRLAAFLQKRAKRGRLPQLSDLTVEDVDEQGASLRLYQPKHLTGPAPALLWIHGGGYIFGQPEQDEAMNVAFARELGITVAAIRYRFGPTHPAPAAVEDAYAALKWLHANAARLNVDPARIAIGGASAGGGLTASLALYAHDRHEIRPAFQLLVYPMVDDRTVTRTDVDERFVRVWTTGSNAWAWGAYLGHAPGVATTSPYAAAARRDDLSGLPPAWVGVGTNDLFHDEDVAYARRLQQAGVPCALYLVPGAFHGFDAIFRNAPVTRAFFQEQVRVLRQALFSSPAP